MYFLMDNKKEYLLKCPVCLQLVLMSKNSSHSENWYIPTVEEAKFGQRRQAS